MDLSDRSVLDKMRRKLKPQLGFTLNVVNGQTGFTLIELLLVMGILTILFGISSLNFFNISNLTTSEVSTNVLVSDIKSQQIKAMVGDTEGRGIPDNYGIMIQANQYTLFHGLTYSATNSSNFTIPSDEGFSLSTTFPQNKLIFASGSGEILNFIDGQNTITITNSQTGQTKTIEINMIGVVTDIN